MTKDLPGQQGCREGVCGCVWQGKRWGKIRNNNNNNNNISILLVLYSLEFVILYYFTLILVKGKRRVYAMVHSWRQTRLL